MLVRLIQRRDHYTCQMCGVYGADAHVTAHHIIPREHGGPTTPKNLILLCDRCHDLAERERMPSAEIIRNWYPEWDRLERLAEIYHREEEMARQTQAQPVDPIPLDASTTHGECYFCGSEKYTYVWRSFWQQEQVMCLACYQSRLARLEEWALKYGQEVTSEAEKSYDRDKRNYSKTHVAHSAAFFDSEPKSDTSSRTDTPPDAPGGLQGDSMPDFSPEMAMSG